MPTRRALIKAASISFAGAPFVNMAGNTLLAQSGSIPALSPSVQQNLKTNLTGVYNSARSRNVTTAQLGTLNGALGIANGLIQDNGTIATIQPHYYPPTFQWTSSLATSLTQNAGSQICPISILDLAIMNSLNQYRSGVPSSAASASGMVLSGFAKMAALDPPIEFRGTPHLVMAQYPYPNSSADCGYQGMAISAAIIAGVTFFIPGGAFVTGLFTLVAAIYAALSYLDVGC